MRKKSADKNIEITSINSYDPIEDVKWFCDKHKVACNVLLNGKEVAQKYGLSGLSAFLSLAKKVKLFAKAGGVMKLWKRRLSKVLIVLCKNKLLFLFSVYFSKKNFE